MGLVRLELEEGHNALLADKKDSEEAPSAQSAEKTIAADNDSDDSDEPPLPPAPAMPRRTLAPAPFIRDIQPSFFIKIFNIYELNSNIL